MSAAETWAGIASVAALVLLLVVVHRPLGDHMARIYTPTKHMRVERGVYRLIGVDPDAEQSWPAYLRSVLLFSVVGVFAIYTLERLQAVLPASLGLPAVTPSLAFDTAVSFVTNTNWQSYSPELTMGYTVQMAGLAVQNFLSAAVGMAVAAALVRGFARRRTGTLGNFWVDTVRTVWRLLLPVSFVFAIVLIAGGAVQNFLDPTTVHTLAGGTQTIAGGPAASQEAIKEFGTNGGGFFNANSAHPFENPQPWTNLLEVFLLLAIPFSLPRTFGTMVGDRRQGYAILATMGVIFLVSLSAMSSLELAGGGTATHLAGAAMEGKEVRFGVIGTTIFNTSSTITSTGAVDGMIDSQTPLGGMMAMINMMLGEIAPGGTGSGLYGMLVLAVITVFIAGLLVGRTPEYLGKKIRAREMTFASLYVLVTPAIVLLGAGLSLVIPGVAQQVEHTSISNPGNHGFSELLYAFTSAANNNGSAFGGITANTTWMNSALAVAMALGRFVPIVLVLALAGSLAQQDHVPATSGTLPTHRPLFIVLLAGVAVIVTALTYFPVLALGPLAEGLVR
ncbi:potassium-transporting ATPase subunit KdpA [Curtobacterium sp. MCBD17_034]|uniref:potassium-transporting ATPase subunit KdpA n=1 Tax=unclassified Curtobacterium TaxID=257496 RepID=UPI000DA92C9A|nr:MULTISPECIES: potassium-transporting ATPase subunit KdpA [unclassified Curtobacterium]PZF60132.1 potassium-transporting ATPase subunit KdpA [Curtobacterium sp. MCBD17_034]PZM34817.1 potassium-transporting ATPase subunit KdpA [Curtobacterium sp. MCBD17_031]WIB63440.1 potassium-transporting ATPase subunit KdpA [Curtobacterium sp. MCBD17_040]